MRTTVESVARELLGSVDADVGHLLASQEKREEARREFQTYLKLAPTDDSERKAVEKEIRKLS